MKMEHFRETESDLDQNLLSTIFNDDDRESTYVKDKNSSNVIPDDLNSDDEKVSESICFHWKRKGNVFFSNRILIV